MCKAPKKPKPIPPPPPVVFQPPPELQIGGDDDQESSERRALRASRTGRASLLQRRPGEVAALTRLLQERFLRPAGTGGGPSALNIRQIISQASPPPSVPKDPVGFARRNPPGGVPQLSPQEKREKKGFARRNP